MSLTQKDGVAGALHTYHRACDGTGSRAALRRVAADVRALNEQLLDEGGMLALCCSTRACSRGM